MPWIAGAMSLNMLIRPTMGRTVVMAFPLAPSSTGLAVAGASSPAPSSAGLAVVISSEILETLSPPLSSTGLAVVVTASSGALVDASVYK